ncbi:hypothetical protein BC941DRAFT_362318 [Chlamydoabsidia padenii]|nr:hypothetical protein BC941DRAFT_362318 [Chlamydoabsidia padenii]
MINGLPSPPVDSPKTEFPTHDDPSLNTTLSTSFSNSLDVKQQQENLSAQHIQSKLTALREEKHRLFQLMKRLVEQEEHQQHTITNTQQSIRKKRPSRWQPSSQQQQQQQQQQYSTRTTFTTASRPYQTQSRSHGYFGQPSVIHHPHQPYLY